MPDIGHACGHNIIAASAVGAALASAKLADESGLTITVIGTLAEEVGGGKILLLESGGFEGVHAAMIVHPAPSDMFPAKIMPLPRLRFVAPEKSLTPQLFRSWFEAGRIQFVISSESMS